MASIAHSFDYFLFSLCLLLSLTNLSAYAFKGISLASDVMMSVSSSINSIYPHASRSWMHSSFFLVVFATSKATIRCANRLRLWALLRSVASNPQCHYTINVLKSKLCERTFKHSGSSWFYNCYRVAYDRGRRHKPLTVHLSMGRHYHAGPVFTASVGSLRATTTRIFHRASCDERLLGSTLRDYLRFLVCHFWLLSEAYASLVVKHPPHTHMKEIIRVADRSYHSNGRYQHGHLHSWWWPYYRPPHYSRLQRQLTSLPAHETCVP